MDSLGERLAQAGSSCTHEMISSTDIPHMSLRRDTLQLGRCALRSPWKAPQKLRRRPSCMCKYLCHFLLAQRLARSTSPSCHADAPGLLARFGSVGWIPRRQPRTAPRRPRASRRTSAAIAAPRTGSRCGGRRPACEGMRPPSGSGHCVGSVAEWQGRVGAASARFAGGAGR